MRNLLDFMLYAPYILTVPSPFRFIWPTSVQFLPGQIEANDTDRIQKIFGKISDFLQVHVCSEIKTKNSDLFR